MFEAGYGATAYFGHLELALVLFGIMAALDIFTDRYKSQNYDNQGHLKPPPPSAQGQHVQVSIFFDILRLAIFSAAGLIFQHFVILA